MKERIAFLPHHIRRYGQEHTRYTERLWFAPQTHFYTKRDIDSSNAMQRNNLRKYLTQPLRTETRPVEDMPWPGMRSADANKKVCWTRVVGDIGEDPSLHAACLCYMSDSGLANAVMNPFGGFGANRDNIGMVSDSLNSTDVGPLTFRTGVPNEFSKWSAQETGALLPSHEEKALSLKRTISHTRIKRNACHSRQFTAYLRCETMVSRMVLHHSQCTCGQR